MTRKQKERKNVSTLINRRQEQMPPHILFSHSLPAALTPTERAEVEGSPTSKATESRSAHQKTDQTQLFHLALPLSRPIHLTYKNEANAKPNGQSKSGGKAKVHLNAHDTQLSQTKSDKSCHRAMFYFSAARPWRLARSHRARDLFFE